MKQIGFIVGAVVVVIIIAIIIRGCGKNYKPDYLNEISRLHAIIRQDSIKSAGSVAVLERLEHKALVDSIESTVVVTGLKRENDRLRSRITKLGADARPIIDSIPVLVAYNAAKDSLIASLQYTIDTVAQHLKICQMAERDLISTASQARAFDARIISNYTRIEAENRATIDSLNLAVKKTRRDIKKPGIAFILGVIAGAFIPD